MNRFLLLIPVILLLTATLASAQEECGNSCGKTCVYFFHGTGCSSCAKVEPYLHDMEEKYDFIDVKEFEVFFNESNFEFMKNFCDAYCIDPANIEVPVVFIGDKYMVGSKSITDNLENEIVNCQLKGCPCPEDIVNNVTVIDDNGDSQSARKLTLPILVGTALVDSINPCAFAVIIFLFTYLQMLGIGSKILKVGITYISVVFIVYFVSGFAILTFIQGTGINLIVYKIAAFIAIVAGLINLKDAFWYGKGITLRIPESQKPLIEKYVKKATIPGAIILGIIVSSVELPCTGEVYISILAMLANNVTRLQAIPYLLLYNFIFVFPLIVILLLMYKGIPPEKVEKWRKDKRKLMKLSMGTVLLLLGILMLLGWI